MFGRELVGQRGLVTPGGSWQPLGSAAGGGSSDPLWSSVILLAGNNQGSNGATVDGTNGADQSNDAIAMDNVIGVPTWTNANTLGGLSTTILTDGNDGLVYADSALYQISSAAGCVEWFFRPTTDAIARMICVGPDAGPRSFLVNLLAASGATNLIQKFAGTTGDGFEWLSNEVTSVAISLNIWYYCAIYWSSGVVYTMSEVYGATGVTPVQISTGETGSLANVATGWGYGLGNGVTTGGFIGQLGPMRVTNAARYTAAAFNVPTAPFPTATT